MWGLSLKNTQNLPTFLLDIRLFLIYEPLKLAVIITDPSQCSSLSIFVFSQVFPLLSHEFSGIQVRVSYSQIIELHPLVITAETEPIRFSLTIRVLTLLLLS